MSQWTHVAGIIRVDGVGNLIGLTHEDEKGRLEELLGHTANYDSPREDWDKCNVPCGSEGSIQYKVEMTGKPDDVVRGHVSICGDLRDYENVKEIENWFRGVLEKIHDVKGASAQRYPFIIRDAVMSIDVEFSGRRLILIWGEKELKKTRVKVPK